MMASPNFNETVSSLLGLYAKTPMIRVVNFHNTSRAKAGQYDRELAHYGAAFSSVNEDELDSYLITGEWHKPKPGLLVVLYEGYRNGHDVIAPLIEKHGLIGWFFIITDFVKAPVKEQISYARSHRIGMRTEEYSDGRYALSWEEIRKLSQKHVIASHARSHTRLASLDPTVVEREVVGAQEDFEKNLGRKVRAFASLTGPAAGEFALTDKMVAAAGYDFVFSNYRIQRVRAHS